MMDQQMQMSTSKSKDGQPFKCFGKIIPPEKVESFKQIREILERERRQRHLALQETASSQSNEFKINSSKKLTPLGFSPSFFIMRDKLRYSKSSNSASRRLDAAHSRGANSYHKKDTKTQKNAIKLPSQECRRALQFESGDEGDGSDDHTAPLAMMDITNMVSGSSLLPPCQPHHQLKENQLPVIKKSIVCLPNTSSGLKSAAHRKRLIKIGEEDDRPESSRVKTRLLRPTIAPLNRSTSRQVLNANVNTQSELEEQKLQSHGKNSAKKVTFAKELKPARRSLTRRSVGTLCVRTPTRKSANRISRAQSMSKIPRHSATQQVIGKSALKRCQKPAISSTARTVNTSIIIGTPEHHFEVECDLKIPQILITPPGNTDNQHQGAEKGFVNKVDTRDAEVNTTVSFVRGSCLDEQLSTELENLSREQDEISLKAKALWEQTHARRQKMKDSGIMKSVFISVSPLGRLQRLLQNRNRCTEDENSSTSRFLNNSGVNENVLGTEASVQSEGTHIDDSSDVAAVLDPHCVTEECSSLNTTSNLNNSNSYWNHVKHDNRFLRTPASMPAQRLFQHMPVQPEAEESFTVSKVELFRDVNEENGESPFAQLVGDCERPSLAPMTPHSRQQVSQLKSSLKKQLELLYD
ncbi:uncharacterized protein [Procambarus clarkii]|uniref:uncharacterized protein isoform X1 n=2 Tax=Procambarus clarkii TaxID=6728 RepID=UPI003743D644